MFKYLKLSNRKGQFFIISAVIIVSALFSIYAVYRGYYKVDGSVVQGIDSSYRLDNIVDSTKELHDKHNESSCSTIRDVLDTYKTFIQRSSVNAGDFIDYEYDSHRGCIQTDFDITVKTRDSRVSKEFSMDVDHEKSFWVMDSCNDFDIEYYVESNGVECSGGNLTLVSGVSVGNAMYEFVPGDNVIWYSYDMELFGEENITIKWYSNESGSCPDSPSFCEYEKFDDLPEEFRWLRVEFILNEMNDGSSPKVDISNVTYATRL